jgi:integrase/recombinase XerD
MISASFPALLQSFFTERLLRQREASPHTIAGYRDSFRLLFRFPVERLGKAPSDLLLADLDAPFIGAFLEHLETRRGNTARTRNARLAAIHSFFGYVALNEPAHALACQRVLPSGGGGGGGALGGEGADAQVARVAERMQALSQP